MEPGTYAHLFVSFRYDYVEIHDGSTENTDLLGKHCSNIAPAPIISSGPSLHIKFVSDYAHQGAGFSLRYEIFKTGKGMLVSAACAISNMKTDIKSAADSDLIIS